MSTSENCSAAEFRIDDVRRHYESLLAPNYTWMFGAPFEAKASEQRKLLEQLLGSEFNYSGLAIDVGSGSGFQSVALADLGFSPVLAIDISETLLQELERNRGGREIATVCGDLRNIKSYVGSAKASAIVCMGDTLPHLPDRDSVQQFFAEAHYVLKPGGSLVLTFRDLSVELHGMGRFIPVHNDADRIMTCFLEFDSEVVTVHDLVHVRKEDGWHLQKSCYRKLRLSTDEVGKCLSNAGFQVEVNLPTGGMSTVVARR